MKINPGVDDTLVVSIKEKDGGTKELIVSNEVIYTAPKKGEPLERHIQWDMSKPFHDGKELLSHHIFSAIRPYWSEKKNTNSGISSSEHDCYSKKQVWWKHSVCNHTFKLSVLDRLKEEPECELCKYLSDPKYSFLITNWNTDKNGDLESMPLIGSMFSWVCKKCNGEFDKTLQGYSLNKNCPHCKASDKSKRDAENARIKAQKELEPRLFGTSHIERQIFYNLKCIFGENMVYSGRRVDNMEIDIYIPSLSIGIEYDGVYFHKDKVEVDQNKNKKFDAVGINLLRIREKGLGKISPDDIVYDYTKNDLNTLFVELFLLITKTTQLDNSVIRNFQRYLFGDINKIIVPSSYFAQVLREDSIGVKFPHIQKEFMTERNGNIDLFKVKKGSRSIIGTWWWKCQYCGFEFQKSMESRINVCGCMKCGRITKNKS